MHWLQTTCISRVLREIFLRLWVGIVVQTYIYVGRGPRRLSTHDMPFGDDPLPFSTADNVDEHLVLHILDPRWSNHFSSRFA